MDFIVETDPDMQATAALGRLAFGTEDEMLNAARFAWTYGPGYDGAIVIAAMKDGIKVGQGVFILEQARIAGSLVRAAQFVDLFVHPEHRGGATVRGIYRGLLEQAAKQGVGFIMATPNPAARELNKRMMGLENLCEIPVRAGLALPLPGGRSIRSMPASGAEPELATLLEPYCSGQATGLHWSAGALARRLGHPNYSYSLHFSENCLLIASPRTIRKAPVLLLASFLVCEGKTCSAAESRRLISAAASFHRRPLFTYAGINAALETLPGYIVPPRFKPPVLVQGRNLADPEQKVVLSRCELLDFDFA